MRSTRRLSVILPDDMAQMVKDKVSSGEYASESDVIVDGLRALEEHENPHEGGEAFEHWLREVIVSYDEVKADPSRTLTIDQVREHLAAKRSASA